jgi:CRISPR type III-B/RAMP module-associated protein Cmr3
LPLLEGEHWLAQRTFLQSEERVGIARATQSVDRLVAAESMLYMLITWRMDTQFRFAVEVELDHLDEALREQAQKLLRGLHGALVRLGGRSQHARVEVIDHSLAPSFPNIADPEPGDSSKLWLWTPGLLDPSRLKDHGSLGVLANTVRVGGFDMAKHRPRPLVSALDRGSVLWFSGSARDAVERHQIEYAQKHGQPAQGGYGSGLWIPTPASQPGSDA